MLRRLIISMSLAVYVLSTTACGVILYPERQGQKSGQIDLTVALLDGVGLFIGVVPGLVAFVIDFHQGTIYLPNSRAAIEAGEPEYRAVKMEFDEERPLTLDQLDSVLSRELGFPINLEQERVLVKEIDSFDQQTIPAIALYSEFAKG